MKSFLRLMRDTPKLAASIIAIAAITAMFLSQMVVQGNAQEKIAETWRGAYDILVLPASASNQELTDEEGRTLLDSNFANVSGDPIPSKLLQSIDKLENVDVAAPIGFIARYSGASEVPTLTIPLDIFDQNSKLALRLTQQVVINDGLTDRLATVNTDTMVLDSSEYEGGPIMPFGENFMVIGNRDIPYVSVGDGNLRIALNQLPDVSTTLFAVDPVKEKMLLGAENSGFLDSLVAFESAVSTLDNTGVATARDLAELDANDPVRQELSKLGVDYASNPALRFGIYGMESLAVPIVQNSDAYPPATLDIKVEKLMGSTSGDAEDILRTMGTADFQNVGTESLNLSTAFQPFAGSQLSLPWPGTDEIALNSYAGKYEASTIGPLQWSPGSDSGPDKRLTSIGVQPQGFTYATSRMNEQVKLGNAGSATGRSLGDSQTYRSTGPIDQDEDGMLPWGFSGMPKGKAAAAPIVTGHFEPHKIIGAGTLPLGAYDSSKVNVLDEEGNTQEALEPTLHGLGLAAQASSALTTLNGAHTLGIKDPVNAIRVRVGGLTGEMEQDSEKIDAVAASIAGLGLSAYPVAGSSPQSVQAFVPKYAFGTDSDSEAQVVDSLGWVALEYTTLGAGITARDAVSTSGAQVASWSQFLVLGSLIALIIIQYPKRRINNNLLVGQSLSYWHRFRWHLSEDIYLVLAVLVLVATLGQRAHLQNADFTRWDSVVPLVVTGLAALVGASLSARVEGQFSSESRTDMGRRLPRLVRVISSRLPMLLTKSVALSLIAVAIAFMVDLVVRSNYLLGTTELGKEIASGIIGPSVVSCAAAAGSGILILATATQSDLKRQASDWVVATRSAAVRWRNIRSKQVFEHFVMFLLAASLTAFLFVVLLSGASLDASSVPVGLATFPNLEILLIGIASIFVVAGSATLLQLALRMARSR